MISFQGQKRGLCVPQSEVASLCLNVMEQVIFLRRKGHEMQVSTVHYVKKWL